MQWYVQIQYNLMEWRTGGFEFLAVWEGCMFIKQDGLLLYGKELLYHMDEKKTLQDTSY